MSNKVYAVQDIDVKGNGKIVSVCVHKSRANQVAKERLVQNSYYGTIEEDELNPDTDVTLKQAYSADLLYCGALFFDRPLKKVSFLNQVEVVERERSSIPGNLKVDEELGDGEEPEASEAFHRRILLQDSDENTITSIKSKAYILQWGYSNKMIFESGDHANQEGKKILKKYVEERQKKTSREGDGFNVVSRLNPKGLYEGSYRWFRRRDYDPYDSFEVKVAECDFVKAAGGAGGSMPQDESDGKHSSKRSRKE